MNTKDTTNVNIGTFLFIHVVHSTTHKKQNKTKNIPPQHPVFDLGKTSFSDSSTNLT